jgi:hypothetical protein
MNKNNWVKVADRKPTRQDADEHGHVLYLFEDGSKSVDEVSLFDEGNYYDDSDEVYNDFRDGCHCSHIPVAWMTLPNTPVVTRDDKDRQEYDRFINTYSLGSSMVNSLNLKLAYEAGLREARKQAREAFDKVEIVMEEDNEETAEAFVASIAE